MAIVNSKGKVIANVAQPTVAFNTEEEYNDWLATLPNPSIDIDKFVIIKNYVPAEGTAYEHIINFDNMNLGCEWRGRLTFRFIDNDSTPIENAADLFDHLQAANYGGLTLQCHGRFDTLTSSTTMTRYEYQIFGFYIDPGYQYLEFESTHINTPRENTTLYLAIDSTHTPSIVPGTVIDHVIRL